MKQPCVYILANRPRGTLYIGMTGDPVRRIWEHRQDVDEGFTKRYGVHSLIYYELHATIADAALRERQMKKWRRAWKVALIESQNSQWHDLYDEIAAQI